MNPKRLFNIYGDQFGTGYAGNVWDTDYIAPAIMTMQGGNRQPMIMESSKRLYNIFGWEGQGHGGNVYDQNALAPTLNTMMGGYRQPMIENGARIRKLTPKECWRLMAFDDDSFERAKAVNSDTQLYRQAGNSIVVTVLEAIFKEMLP